jgi:hypothetical protein
MKELETTRTVLFKNTFIAIKPKKKHPKNTNPQTKSGKWAAFTYSGQEPLQSYLKMIT